MEFESMIWTLLLMDEVIMVVVVVVLVHLLKHEN